MELRLLLWRIMVGAPTQGFLRGAEVASLSWESLFLAARAVELRDGEAEVPERPRRDSCVELELGKMAS